MKIFPKSKKRAPAPECVSTQTSNYTQPAFFGPHPRPPFEVYRQIREAIPIVDAAITKIIRLVGDFNVEMENPIVLKKLQLFLKEVNVVGNSNGINSFLNCYLDSLLTFGNAIGEIVLNPQGSAVAALCNADATKIHVRRAENSVGTEFFVECGALEPQKIKKPQLIMFSSLNPIAGEVNGNSLIKGLPFVGDILIKIYKSIGLNFDRVGNIRFAVNYKPDPNLEIDSVQEIAQSIAHQWENAMKPSNDGCVKDFVAVGDIDVRVIGADNKVIDTAVPVRQMLEQIVAKMGIPPFLLGLCWSTTERMSKQQCEILTSEIQSYRRILTPVINKIVSFWLRLQGLDLEFDVVWEKINLQDELDQAKAQLIKSQAQQMQAGN